MEVFRVRWTKLEFKRNRTHIEDAPCPGTPKSAVTPEKIGKIHDIVLANRGVKVRELAEAVGISNDQVHFISQHEIHKKRLCAQWVPHLLTLEQNRNRMPHLTNVCNCLRRIQLIFCKVL